MKSVRRAAPAVLAVVFLLASGCGRGGEKAGPVAKISNFVQAKLGRGPILRVESREFSNDDLQAYIRTTGGNEAKGLSAASLSRLFDRFVDDRILLEAARQRNLTLTWDEKKSYLAKRAGETDTGQAPPEQDVAGPDSIFDGLLVDKYTYQVIKDIHADDAEVQAYYRQGDLPYDMEKVIFALNEGKVSQVVESSYGYHVFRLDKKFPPQLQSLADAAPAIRIKVLEQRIKEALAAHLEGLKDTLSWKTFPENLFFAYQRLDQ
jgi:hypothetical protein